MSLIDVMSEPFVRLTHTRVADGEGGHTVTWTEGARFTAAAILNAGTQTDIAQHEGIRETYTVTVNRSVKLTFHDVIKRISDGKTFRIIDAGGEKRTPSTATIDMMQVTAERWDKT